MTDEPLIYREEVTAALFALFDVKGNVATILELLQGDDDAEAPEEDT